jgi:hypothetical protein
MMIDELSGHLLRTRLDAVVADEVAPSGVG